MKIDNEHEFKHGHGNLRSCCRRLVSLLPAALLLAACCAGGKGLAQSPDPYAWARQNILVAHALGGIGKYEYTNSKEAFLTNYGLGHRLFEMDFSLTSDSLLVGLHDWESLNGLGIVVPQGITLPMTYDQFLSTRIQKTLTPLGLTDVIGLMQEYPDFYLITDTKLTSGTDMMIQWEELVGEVQAADPLLLDRIIPQFYNQAMYAALKTIYPFKSWIYTIYQSTDTRTQIVNFVIANGIKVVTLPDFWASPDFLHVLRANGIYPFVHTINDPNQASVLMSRGAQGIYTDFINPSMLQAGALEWQGYH